jgi:acetyltransferase
MSALFDVAWALSCQPLPNGQRAAIFTNAGGPAALASDSLAVHGFGLAEISLDQQAKLAEKLNPSAQVANPVDMLGGAEPEEFAHCLTTLRDDPAVDVFLPILVPQSLVNPGDVARAIVESTLGSGKTTLACMVGEQSLDEARMVLHQNNVPMSIFPDVPGKILGAMAQYRDWLAQAIEPAMQFTIPSDAVVDEMLEQAQGQAMGEVETRPILEAYGMDLVPGAVAVDADQAAGIAAQIGFPVVVKIISPQVLHKSDFGGIALNLVDEQEVKLAAQKMRRDISQAVPDAEIRGFLVEKMAPKGMEVIVGMRRDPNFGPLMMFGLGGVMVELFKDVGFGVAPLTQAQARAMVRKTKAGVLLEGYRGGPAYDLDAVIETLGRLSQLALDHPEIAEVEINPLLVLPAGQGAQVLDARIILSTEKTE